MIYLFDLDGTLLDSNGIWLDIDIAFLGSRGISPVPPSYTDYVTYHSYPESAQYTKEQYNLPECAEEIMAQWLEMAREAYGATLELKSGAKELLEQLSLDGQEMALLCQLTLAHHDIAKYFTRVMTATELGASKSDSSIYHMAAKQCGIGPEECVFFDDSPAYCAAAKAAGMVVVGVSDPLYDHRRAELQEICDHYLTSLDEYL